MNSNYSIPSIQNEEDTIKTLLPNTIFKPDEKIRISNESTNLAKIIRNSKNFSIEEFFNQYSLSREEGVAILGLSEALLRIPDDLVARELAHDKLSNKRWADFLPKSAKSVKTFIASFGLYFSGKFSDLVQTKHIIGNIIAKIGEVAFIKILKLSVTFLSKEFIFADNMKNSLSKIKKYNEYRFAFDLLGESARTLEQSHHYYKQYQEAIELISSTLQDNSELHKRSNLSIKLTALYPRFELKKLDELKDSLLPKLIKLVEQAQKANLTITFDAEESFRIDTYLLLLTELIHHKNFVNYNGIGFVVQAYNVRAYEIIDYLISIAKKLNKKIPIRLVKGAYWDSEIKLSQEKCLESYPVFTKKEYTDVSYIACARKILDNDKYLYPQFATHNAASVATIIELSKGKEYEFQKLFGMGNVLHSEIVKNNNVRIYAPIGNIKDLLSYLIRRILENGASANFVSQIHSESSIDKILGDVHDNAQDIINDAKITLPQNIYQYRKTAMGYEMGNKNDYDKIKNSVNKHFDKTYQISSIINGETIIGEDLQNNFYPGRYGQKFSTISYANEREIKSAIDIASKGFVDWSNVALSKRVDIIENIANLLEEKKFEIYAILIQEAGKSIEDAITELQEAVDFCRYYANQATSLMKEKDLPSITGESNILSLHPRGIFLCISPWNFPLAIFLGQIVAALVVGNSVITKPAAQTPVIASYVVNLMHKAGINKSALQLLITNGSNIGKYVVSDERISGVAFTGSCATAKLINLTLAKRESDMIVPLIAETGGQNAMIVDSSALLEQVTDDILISAFYSAGQRCSALRILYIQEEIYDELLQMIKQATEILNVGDTSDFSTDIGPLIDANSKKILEDHIKDMRSKNFNIFAGKCDKSLNGHFLSPHIIEINSINDISDEKFGPILHVVKYQSDKIDDIINEINNCGFGLTFGIHSRIEEKIKYIGSKIKVGNIYVNRTIVGARVESQPFGGENKSGTGFKAGGPHYLLRFMTERTLTVNKTAFGGNIDLLH